MKSRGNIGWHAHKDKAMSGTAATVPHAYAINGMHICKKQQILSLSHILTPQNITHSLRILLWLKPPETVNRSPRRAEQLSLS